MVRGKLKERKSGTNEVENKQVKGKKTARGNTEEKQTAKSQSQKEKRRRKRSKVKVNLILSTVHSAP